MRSQPELSCPETDNQAVQFTGKGPSVYDFNITGGKECALKKLANILLKQVFIGRRVKEGVSRYYCDSAGTVRGTGAHSAVCLRQKNIHSELSRR